MARAGPWAAAEKGSKPLVEPGSEDREPRKQGQHEEDGDAPVHQTCIDVMAQDFVVVNGSASEARRAMRLHNHGTTERFSARHCAPPCEVVPVVTVEGRTRHS